MFLKIRWEVLFFVIAISSSALAAHEGSSGRGGGDEIRCNGGPLVFFSDHDDQITDLSGTKNTLPPTYFDSIDPAVVQEAILSFADHAKVPTWEGLRGALNHITFTEVDSVEKIDTGVKVSFLDQFFGCSRVQVAVQDFDVGSPGHSLVRIASKPYGKLPNLGKVLLRIHEGFIYLHRDSKDLREMETLARQDLGALYNSAEFDGWVVPRVLKAVGVSDEGMTLALRPWLDDVLGRSEFLDPKVVRAGIDDLVNSGLEPNAILECKMPVLDYVMGHLRGGAGDDGPSLVSSEAAIELLARGADPNRTDMAGRSPLDLAAYIGDHDLVQALVNAGAEVNDPWCPPGIQDGTVPWTPLDLAKDPGQGNDDAAASVLRSVHAGRGRDLKVILIPASSDGRDRVLGSVYLVQGSGIRCSARPKITKDAMKAAGCDQIKGVVAPELMPNYRGGGLYSIIRPLTRKTH